MKSISRTAQIDPMKPERTKSPIYSLPLARLSHWPGTCRFHVNRTIDASGLIVCPGLIDLSVRLREPGYEYKATLESEISPRRGGITSLACPPDTTRRWTTRLGRNAEVPRQKLPGPRVYHSAR